MSQTEEPKKRILQELVELLEELKRIGINRVDIYERPEGVSVVVGNVEYIYDALDIDDVQIELVSHGYVVHREGNVLHVE
ncbi:MAG: hypothetical protein RXR02_05000 [Thermoproteus sp.]